MKIIRSLLVAASLLSPSMAMAQPPAINSGTLTYRGDVGANGTIDGYQIGPYRADFSGFANTPGFTSLNGNNAIIWCVDFNHFTPPVNAPDSYVASRLFGPGVDLSQTRYGNAALGGYRAVAWLIEQYNPALPMSSTGFTAGNIQGTIWDPMGGSSPGASMSDAYNTNLASLIPASFTLQYEWYVVSDVGNGDSNQEFLTARVSTVPEPSTYALMSAGLVVMGLAARRRRRTA